MLSRPPGHAGAHGRFVLSPAPAPGPAAAAAAAAGGGQGMALSSVEHLGLTCIVLFLAALGAGFLPLLVQVSEAQLSLAGALGAGLLVGTALAVIIPEGFHAFQAADTDTGGALPDWCVGAVLVAGFLAMLLLDHAQQAASAAGGKGNGHAGHAHARAIRAHASDDEVEEGSAARVAAQKAQSEAAGRALVGLLVHSAADGFAVGAAAVSTSSSLSFLVAVAMVLHKAPVAFGLATFLMAARWPWGRLRRGLLLFAAASPVTAVVTYALILVLPGLSSPASIALCVLFSGGTFLYASCIHILPEIVGERGRLGMGELTAVIGGCLVPIVVAAVQGEHHH